MITKLYLQNFRSVKDKIELPLSPLTVFAGANSSGKSTVLKALLLISQTFRHRDKNCPILLNGPLVSLGSFDSIINSEKSTTEIIFGFDFGASHVYQVTTGSRYKNNTFFVKSGTYIFSLIEKDGSDKNKIEISKLSFRILRGKIFGTSVLMDNMRTTGKLLNLKMKFILIKKAQAIYQDEKYLIKQLNCLSRFRYSQSIIISIERILR